MKPILKPFRIFSAIALLAFVTGCATTQTTNTDLFTQAGFKLVNADTPKKQELLKTLPAGQVSVIKWKGKTFYVEPAATPNQAYVGTEKEFHAYEQLRIARQMRNDQIMAAHMDNVDRATWDAWGPSFYGGFYGNYYR